MSAYHSGAETKYAEAMVFNPSALIVSVIGVLHSGMLKVSTRQYHIFHGECTARRELHTINPAPCNLFPFDIGNHSSGQGYLINFR